jgi:hypothetical protein
MASCTSPPPRRLSFPVVVAAPQNDDANKPRFPEHKDLINKLDRIIGKAAMKRIVIILTSIAMVGALGSLVLRQRSR